MFRTAKAEKVLRQDYFDACEKASNCKENDPLKAFYIENAKDCHSRWKTLNEMLNKF